MIIIILSLGVIIQINIINEKLTVIYFDLTRFHSIFEFNTTRN